MRGRRVICRQRADENGVADPQIGRALAAIHHNVGLPWSAVACALARAAGSELMAHSASKTNRPPAFASGRLYRRQVLWGHIA